MKTVVCIVAMLGNCVGCTTIHITQEGGSVQIERRFGFAKIVIPEQIGVVTAKVSSFGYFSSPVGHSLGFSKQSITGADGSCRLIVWVNEHDGSRRALQEMEFIHSMCIVD